MSRQAQNILIGGLACVVAAMAMVAVALFLTGGDNNTTSAEADQLPEGLALSEQSAAEPAADPAAADTRSSLAVTVAPPAEALSSTETTALTTTTAPASTLIVTTTAATTTTAAPVSSTTALSTTTTAPASTSTMATTATTVPTDSSTTVPDQGSSTTDAPTTTAPPTTVPDAGSLNAVELEIARLTNELRTEPNGRLKRQGPVPDCDGALRVDRATGVYESLAPVEIHKVASLEVARPWSAQMTRNLQHRPKAGGPALQAAGIPAVSYGENIAFHNYPEKAMQHFVGWRESDGHFCNMMIPQWSHLGVGEVTKANGDSFATQNFFHM